MTTQKVADLANAKVPLWALLVLLAAGGGTAGMSLIGSASGTSNADTAVLDNRVSRCETNITALQADVRVTRENVLLLCQAQGLDCQH